MSWTESALDGMHPLCRALVTGPFGDAYYLVGLLLFLTIPICLLLPLILSSRSFFEIYKRRKITAATAKSLGKIWLLSLSPWIIFILWMLCTECYIWYA